ncbi:pantothenate synthase [Trapelia coarctata]|nr:pantothenate synthase [Trapelia coarctata]
MPRSIVRKFFAAGSLSSNVSFVQEAFRRVTTEDGVFRKHSGKIKPKLSRTASVAEKNSTKTPLSSGPLPAGVGLDGKKPTVPGPSCTIKCLGDPKELRFLRDRVHSTRKKVALVPTMGALHDGHLKLIRKAALDNHEVYVSIYVNPTQFGVNEDLESYPKPWKQDLEKLEKLNSHLKSRAVKGRITTVFRPSTKTMYPTLPPTSELDGHGSFVTITPLATVLEGASRPVFFRGVTTVVMKLLNIVQPDEVYFGQKDVQQLLVIRRMMKDFHIKTTLRVGQTVRDPKDGLALSSRNVYLGDRRRAVAPVLHKALKVAHFLLSRQGKRTRQEILGPAIEVAAQALREQRKLRPSQRVRFEIDYLSLADPDTLEELQVVEHGKSAILSGAMVMLPIEDPQPGENTGVGNDKLPVRLIDNYIYLMGELFPKDRK